MKFIRKGESDDLRRGLGQVITDHALSLPTEAAQQLFMLAAIAAIADATAPWHMKRIGEELGFIQVHG